MLNIVFIVGGFTILKWIFLKVFRVAAKGERDDAPGSALVTWREPQPSCDLDQIG
jgi:hypothetical protein